MNLVLHRAQVALNMPDFDISDQVASQLNKMLPSAWAIPPDGVAVSASAAGRARRRSDAHGGCDAGGRAGHACRDRTAGSGAGQEGVRPPAAQVMPTI